MSSEISMQRTILDKNHSVDASLIMPVSGLFIGISNYQEEAQVQPTMAHTVSASLMYSFLSNLSYIGRSSSNNEKDLLPN